MSDKTICYNNIFIYVPNVIQKKIGVYSIKPSFGCIFEFGMKSINTRVQSNIQL